MRTKRTQFIIDLLKTTVHENQKQICFLSRQANHWEKWLQVEIGTRLLELGAQEVCLEAGPYLFDERRKNTVYRINKNYKNTRIDLKCRLKGERKGRTLGFELKQSTNILGIKSLLEDMVKAQAIASSSWEFRSFYFALFYYEELKGKYKDLQDELVNRKDIGGIHLTFDQAPNLNCLLVYWDVGANTRKMTSEAYQEWFTKIEELIYRYKVNICSTKKQVINF